MYDPAKLAAGFLETQKRGQVDFPWRRAASSRQVQRVENEPDPFFLRDNEAMNFPHPATGAHVTKKRFGQHFLHDKNILRRIVEAVSPRAGDRIVEIGPGEGALTFPLLRLPATLTTIELDRDLIEPLRARAAGVGELTIVHRDVLSVDFGALAEGGVLRLVGNLPYNISTPILFHCLDHAAAIEDMHFMLQKEVVDRMAARPRQQDLRPPQRDAAAALFGRTAVRRAAGRVPAAAEGRFRGRAARSIHAVAAARRGFSGAAFATIERVVRAAFGQRRKTLSNALSTVADRGPDRRRRHRPARARRAARARGIRRARAASRRGGWPGTLASRAVAFRIVRRQGPVARAFRSLCRWPQRKVNEMLASAARAAQNPCMTEQDRYSITVAVQTQFLQDQSAPDDNRFAFSYTIKIDNVGAVPARLISRHWIITDANGKVQEVRGDGVVGETALAAARRRFPVHLGRGARDARSARCAAATTCSPTTAAASTRRFRNSRSRFRAPSTDGCG